MTQYEPQGIRFVVSENDCDTLGNSVYSTIYASDAHGHHRVALIKFGPDERSAPPTISIESNETIVIAIDSVAELVHEPTFIAHTESFIELDTSYTQLQRRNSDTVQ
jgi:hypothetical protein